MAEYLPMDYEQRCSDRLNSQRSEHSVLTIVATQNHGTIPLSNTWRSPAPWSDGDIYQPAPIASSRRLRHRAITEAAHGITLLARSSSNMRKNISSVSTASWNP